MIRVLVELGADRNRPGTLTVIDGRGLKLVGPFPVAGRASDSLAAARGNPRRDSILRYGDTPTGTYRFCRIAKSGNGTRFGAAQFGPHGVVVLEGAAGAAAIAEANGRFHILVEGGKPGPSGALRSTAGALRLANEHQRALVALLRKADSVTFEIVESKQAQTKGRVVDDGKCADSDPPFATADSDSGFPLPLSRRDALRTGGAAGAVALGLSVTFVGFESTTPARAYTKLAYNEPAPPTPETNEAPQGTNGGAAPATGAEQQLENATGGNQTTGQTFDNGKGPTDATPQGNTQAPPEVTPPPEPQPPEPPPPEPPPPQAPPPEPPAPEPPPQEQPPPPSTPEPTPPPEPPPPTGYTPPAQPYTAPPGNSTTYGPGDERTTGGGINQIQGGGQPITGAGVTQGAPDKAPPPNPTSSGPVYTPNSAAPSYTPRSSAPAYTPPPSPPSQPATSPPLRTSPSYTSEPTSPVTSAPVTTTSTPAATTPSTPATPDSAAKKRGAKTVIDIFPAGPTPKSGQKPLG
jgi:hypothetical protein